MFLRKVATLFAYGWRTNWYTREWAADHASRGSSLSTPPLMVIIVILLFTRGSISNNLMKQLDGAQVTLQAFVPLPKCCLRCEGGCFLQQAISLPCSLKQMKKLLDTIWQVRPRHHLNSSSSIRQQYARLYVTVKGA